MEPVQIIGAALVAAVLSVVLRQYRPEYSMFISLGTGVILLTAAALHGAPILRELRDSLSAAGVDSGAYSILFRSLGICFVTQLAADACKDAGESSIAGKVELTGKVTVLLLSLPLFVRILSTAAELLSL